MHPCALIKYFGDIYILWGGWVGCRYVYAFLHIGPSPQSKIRTDPAVQKHQKKAMENCESSSATLEIQNYKFHGEIQMWRILRTLVMESSDLHASVKQPTDISR